MPCDRALFLHGSSTGVTVCLLPADCSHQNKPTAPTKPWETTWLTSPLRQQVLYLGFVNKKKMEDFLNVFGDAAVCGVLSVLRHNAVPAFSVFSFDFV